ncbi:MAG TPA: peptidyl-tRNA hydrolase [Candidatus Limnocylindrales bacterium]|nr:peptidyl-tRNA hydrolase [Candidatus Limnocylindrales bacterium]
MTRGDLPPGVQCCQAVHAAVEFTLAYPALAGDWHSASNTLAILAASDELALAWLCRDAVAAGLRHARFREPDLGGVLTAAAFEPAAKPLLKHLPTALTRRREVMT